MKTFFIICLLPVASCLFAQATIAPAFTIGRYQHYAGENYKTLAMLSISAGYKFTVVSKDKYFYPLTELSVSVPLINNSLPLSFTLHAGAYLPVFNKTSFIVAAGPEYHLQQLYKYPLNRKDAPSFPVERKLQWSGKVRCMKQFQEDESLQLYTELAYEMRMPLVKVGMFITINKHQ